MQLKSYFFSKVQFLRRNTVSKYYKKYEKSVIPLKFRSTDCHNRTCQMGPIAISDKITVTDHTFFGSIPLVARARAFRRVLTPRWRRPNLWHAEEELLKHDDKRTRSSRKRSRRTNTFQHHDAVQSRADPTSVIARYAPWSNGASQLHVYACVYVYNVCKECNAKERERRGERKKEKGWVTREEEGQIDFSPSTTMSDRME